MSQNELVSYLYSLLDHEIGRPLEVAEVLARLVPETERDFLVAAINQIEHDD